jgi:MFS family permease
VIVGASLVVARVAIPESPVRMPSRVDVGGALLLGVALASALLAVSEGNRYGWSSLPIAGLFVGSVVAFALWVLVELRVADPLVDIRMLARRTVLFTNICSLCAGWGLGTMGVLVPLMAAAPLAHGYGLGANASEISLLLLPGAAGGILSGVIAARMSRRFGARRALAFGVASIGFGYVVAALLHDRPWQILLAQALLGFGAPFHHLAATSLVIQAVRPTETGVATSLNSVMRTIGSALGAQIPASILVSSTIAGTTAPTEGAFIAGFAISGAVCFVGVLFGLLASPRSPGASPATAR